MIEFYGQSRIRADVRAKILARQKHERFVVLRLRDQWAVMPFRLFVGAAA